MVSGIAAGDRLDGHAPFKRGDSGISHSAAIRLSSIILSIRHNWCSIVCHPRACFYPYVDRTPYRVKISTTVA